MGSVEAAILGLAGSPWLLVAVWAMATLDGVFPPVPSESLVIAVAVLTLSPEGPAPVALVLAAALGAFTGDLLAFTVGRHLPLRRWWLFRSNRGQSALDWAERALASRGGAFILGARFVPVARVAVNMTAGATRFPLRRFVPIAAVAALVWAAYTAGIGLAAGAVLAERPVLAMLVGVVVGAVLGTVVDLVHGRVVARNARAAARGRGLQERG